MVGQEVQVDARVLVISPDEAAGILGVIIGTAMSSFLVMLDQEIAMAWSLPQENEVDPDWWSVIDRSARRYRWIDAVRMLVVGPRVTPRGRAPAALRCVTCPAGGDPNPYAEANLADGRFQCFSCRSVNRRIRAV